jgi:acyl-CoA dehydrogenase
VVPAANLIGQEGRGFRGIMHNFNNERLMIASQCADQTSAAPSEHGAGTARQSIPAHGRCEALGRVCYEEALEWARERKTFGHRLADYQA